MCYTAPMETWTLLYRYKRAADDELVAPLSCPDCEREFTFVIGPDDEPVALCVWEEKKFYPGVAFWQEVQRVINELEE